MACNGLITAGVTFDCSDINAPIGVEKDLILVNYDEFDHKATFLASNREADDTNGNEDGLTDIELKSGATQNKFEGTDYSVIPTVTSELRDDGNSWFLHSIQMTVFNKEAKTRARLKELARSRVIAIAVDRSTGLFELFGADQGLKMSELSRVYVGEQNSNFYTVTLATPEVAVVRESGAGELAVNIATAP
jgi:hypothetical protein